MKKKVIVIGAGLGGMSAAISLAAKGYDVSVFEKNPHVGGKLNVLRREGFSFDLGPSILTLPHYFRQLFTDAGKNMDDYVTFVPVVPHWRNIFEDGLVLDLYQDRARMHEELKKLPLYSDRTRAQFDAFLAYAKQQYDIVESGYFAKGLDNLWDFLKFYGFFKLGFKIDHKRKMSETIAQSFDDPYLRDIFEYFIKYVGSSALDAPGFMNLMPNIQFEFDLWYVKGGMYNLARALQKLAEDVGVKIYLNQEIATLEKKSRRIVSVQSSDGAKHEADYVISNMEVIPAYEKLLQEDRSFMKKLEKFEPSCSGLVVHLGTNKVFPKLAHHNFFYSNDQHHHFRTVFHDGKIPEDPTIYLVAPTRSDPTQAPEGCDNIKILPHIPYIREGGFTREEVMQLKDRVITKLERMGLEGLRKSIIVEDVWTPFDIQRTYYSNKGSIYGVASDWDKNYAFKAPKKSKKYENLYFVGGSVNPGGGMPMVVLCGQNVAKAISASDRG